MTSDRGTSGAAELELNNTPVTPKLPGLNPNATVFLSHKSLPEGHTPDTGQWDHNDSGIGNSTTSVSDYSFANGDVSVDKTETAVFSPGSESPFQPELPPFTDNHTFNDDNADVQMKLDNTMGNLILDTGGFVEPPAAANFPADVGVPMQGVQFASENGSVTDGESQTSDGNVPDDQMRNILKTQLESYFSRENLSNDSYLQSQMDADQYVPIATVASLDQIQRLTTDLQLIVELLRESTFVQVDEKGEKVRPNHNRCIVILREIPDATPVEDVQNLFAGHNCPKFVSCEFAHNSNWYVTFDSDADAQRAYQYLREEVRTFLGKPIMARIKAKPLIRYDQPRNGYIKRYQAPGPQVAAQIPQEPVTPVSSASQQQYTATSPYTLMQNVSPQSLYGQQAIPFYPPPPSQLLQTWPNHTMLDPSMVLAMNGYQATNVKVNNQVPNRNIYNNVNSRVNNRNQNKPVSGGQSLGRERINSNDSLPPRLQHQQERQQNAVNNNSNHQQHHKTNHQISNHPPLYPPRRGDVGHPMGHGNHSNHSTHHGGPSHGPHSGSHAHHQGGSVGPHSGPHSGGGGVPPPHHHHSHHQQQQAVSHHQQHHQQQHLDGNNNTSNNSNGVTVNRMSSSSQNSEISSRYAGKSYRSRRRREEDGARPNRSNSSQTSGRDGPPPVPGRPMSADKFDYEPTNFPPLPGAESNTASGEVFESKLSDVVKGTAKPQVRDMPKSTSPSSATPPATATVTTTTAGTVVSKSPSTTVVKEAPIQPTSAPQQTMTVPHVTPSTRVATSAPPTHQPSVSQNNRSSKIVQQQPQESVPESKWSTDKQQSPASPEEKTASLPPNSVKLSYAQMVQKAKVAEVSANSLADRSDESDSEETAETATTTSASSRALKEQGQHQTPSNSSSKQTARGSGRDFARKDSNYDSESRRDNNEFRKENDYRRDDPREQRSNRRLKENRERRFGGDRDRDSGRRVDRRDRDGPLPREREGPRAAVAK